MTGELFLSHSISKLTLMREFIEERVRSLDVDQVWQGPQNSIGNLVLHLCGNVRQWIGWSVGGLPDIRQRDLEFALESRIGTEELLVLLNSTVGEAIAILQDLPPERLTERVATHEWRAIRAGGDLPGGRPFSAAHGADHFRGEIV